ncbi:hypothetical protein NM688_g8176 [Phlebia brevispora]|uniref:Uncharacterized protein n=1 Tax=Phlebia brevispora TaxID=194682 RepID=A0ACC1RW98_9APHY|nr:hypothetical protein NM688_g8176 [Phlebia brevispora]
MEANPEPTAMKRTLELVVDMTSHDLDQTTLRCEAQWLASRGIAVASGRSRVATAVGANGLKTAVISFQDNTAMQKALKLSASERELRDKQMDLDYRFDGFTTLSEGRDLDIVVLHGLNGHAFATWEDIDQTDRFMWLRDCLPEHFPHARVLTYGYNANVLSDVSTGRLRSYAETFLENLKYERSSEAHRDRPLMLMAHYLGGLVIKQALIVANTRADRRYHEILESICGIIFFGIPHRGGNGVKSGIHTFFETNKTKIKAGPLTTKRILVVDEQSAILGVARERKASVNADHSYICKFRGPSDGNYMSVHRVITELVNAATPVVTTRDATTQPEAPPDLKYVNLTDPHSFGFDEKLYPVLVWGDITYWGG